jgi:SAM-dependent methyltransferase
MAELLIGCGGKRKKHLTWNDKAEWDGLVTLDINPDHEPDVVHDLTALPLPFADNQFDEIHAYEVLEHTGQQGDWRFFFAQFAEFYRILKPGGKLFGSSPAAMSKWAWGDPGHTRVMSEELFIFLHQPSYTAQVGVTPMSDYRFVFQGDFDPLMFDTSGGQFFYIIEAVKPSRITGKHGVNHGA